MIGNGLFQNQEQGCSTLSNIVKLFSHSLQLPDIQRASAHWQDPYKQIFSGLAIQI
jgi:hypothetical protein